MNRRKGKQTHSKSKSNLTFSKSTKLNKSNKSKPKKSRFRSKKHKKGSNAQPPISNQYAQYTQNHPQNVNNYYTGNQYQHQTPKHQPLHPQYPQNEAINMNMNMNTNKPPHVMMPLQPLSNHNMNNLSPSASISTSHTKNSKSTYLPRIRLDTTISLSSDFQKIHILHLHHIHFLQIILQPHPDFTLIEPQTYNPYFYNNNKNIMPITYYMRKNRPQSTPTLKTLNLMTSKCRKPDYQR